MKKILLIFSMLSIISILYSVEITESGVLFEYEDENAQSVFLVGSMNNWNTTATPMEKDENGIWKVVLKLNSGKHTYKFMVDGNWQVDPQNPNLEDDGYGGSNSVIDYNSRFKSDVKLNYKNSNGIETETRFRVPPTPHELEGLLIWLNKEYIAQA